MIILKNYSINTNNFFGMRRLLIISIGILIFSCEQPREFPTFTSHVIDTIGSHLGQTDLADMDNDGDLDWIVGQSPWSKLDMVWWWEYQAPDRWIRHDIGKANSDVGGDCYDVDGDGWMDFWGGELLYLNNHDGTFSKHEVGTVFSHDSQFGDVNGDGKMDGVANFDEYGLVWYDIADDPRKPWTEHMVQPFTEHEIHGGVSPQPLGDIDGDGDNDIVTGEAWYENRDGAGLSWAMHKNIELGEWHKYGIALRTWVIDLDEDGDEDVVQAEADNPDGRVAWFENDGSGQWTRHMIKDAGEGQDFHSLIVADFDNDGDWDVSSGGGPLSQQPHKIYIWENVRNRSSDASGKEWIEHVIAEFPCHEAVGGDVDGDGDIDICTKPWSTGNTHYYLENKLYE